MQMPAGKVPEAHLAMKCLELRILSCLDWNMRIEGGAEALPMLSVDLTYNLQCLRANHRELYIKTISDS
jgi:hypothetical protein